MQHQQPISSRKKFLLWAAGAAASVTALKFLSGKKKKETIAENSRMKMLTQDGKLVEVDKDLIIHSARKITDRELQQWVKNNHAQH